MVDFWSTHSGLTNLIRLVNQSKSNILRFLRHTYFDWHRNSSSSPGVQDQDGQGEVLAEADDRVAVVHLRIRGVRLQKW